MGSNEFKNLQRQTDVTPTVQQAFHVSLLRRTPLPQYLKEFIVDETIQNQETIFGGNPATATKQSMAELLI